MQISEIINTLVDYIEKHLSDDIDIKNLAKLVGINEFILNQLFTYSAGISIVSYIRNRRLSKAANDLIVCDSVLDIALKYGYENATSFARAFKNFHGINPSDVKRGNGHLKNYPIIHLERRESDNILTYSIVNQEDRILYGKCIKSDDKNINNDAPEFWQYMNKLYRDKYGNIDYGAVVTTSVKETYETYEYWILYDKKIDEFEKFVIPKSKYLVFRIDRVEAEDIQEMCREVFNKFLPSTDYEFNELPELEHYHDDVVDYYVPIG